MKKNLLLTSLLFTVYFVKAQTLVGYYPLNGNANDASGNGINGTVNGATLATDRGNAPNQAYGFVPNQYIDLGSSATLKPTAAISFGGWFYRASWANSTGEGMFGCTETAGYELYVSNTSMSGWVRRNGAYATINIPVGVISNGWHFFLCTYDGRYTRIYMDGIQQTDFNDAGATYPIEYINNRVIIGAEAGTNGPIGTEYFTGRVDDIRIYNGALSSSAVAALYSTTLPVHLQNFTVVNNNGAALLKWSTENETDFSRYKIDRSIDGVNFTAIQEIRAKSANGRNDYLLADALVIKGAVYYYRLQMINKDGTFTFSNVVRYSFQEAINKISIYPNPVTDYFIIRGLDVADLRAVEIINLKGSHVRLFTPSSNNRYSLSGLQSGVYTARIIEKDETTSVRFVK